MARSTKRSADAPPTPTDGSPSRPTNGSSSRITNRSPSRPTGDSSTAPTRVGSARVPRQTAGPTGLGSPIYEELVAELGDPTS